MRKRRPKHHRALVRRVVPGVHFNSKNYPTTPTVMRQFERTEIVVRQYERSKMRGRIHVCRQLRWRQWEGRVHVGYSTNVVALATNVRKTTVLAMTLVVQRLVVRRHRVILQR